MEAWDIKKGNGDQKYSLPSFFTFTLVICFEGIALRGQKKYAGPAPRPRGALKKNRGKNNHGNRAFWEIFERGRAVLLGGALEGGILLAVSGHTTGIRAGQHVKSGGREEKNPRKKEQKKNRKLFDGGWKRGGVG